MNVIVVGSGPAGVSTAKALLERGMKVTLLDVGNTLETEKQILLNQIQQTEDLKNTDSLRNHANAKNNRKLPYGSNFIYDDIQNYFSWKTEDCYFQPSFARGGLSNVWGGAIDEHSANELSEWPLTCRDLSAYYANIIAWLGKYYKLDTSSVLSQQGVHLKNTWCKNQNILEKKGFAFRAATLAVDFNSCRSCGFCQYGCPYGLIYQSSFHLDFLKQSSNFSYVKNVVVENFSETQQQIELVVRDHHKDKKIQRIFADRLFIACGAGLSSLLYLRSLNQAGKELFLKDSQHFMLPCLLDKKIKGVIDEPLHTLCQLKTTLTQKSISTYPIYLQFYTYMGLYLQEMRNKVKWLYPVFKPMLKSYAQRLVAIQGYLNSKESNYLSIKYQTSGQFEIRKIQSSPVTSTINKVVKYLNQQKEYLALKPLNFLLFQSLTGQSNHVSGSLAMSDNPKEDQADIWGRPSHFKRIHFVDGSILPTMPAGSPTLTIMANAYRIGKEVPL